MKLQTYTVNGELSINVAIQISAKSLADAVEQSSKLTESDFVKMHGDYVDGSMRIVGVWE